MISTFTLVKEFLLERTAFRMHPAQRQAIEEECLVITEVVRGAELPDLDLLAEAPMLLGHVPCHTDSAVPRNEIIFEVDGKEVARITGIEVPAGY